MRGKPHRPKARGGTPVDHPRGCGENRLILSSEVSFSGSPPRMRGKLTDVVAFVNVLEDHPRGCGENLLMPSHKPLTRGSPPRMRGKPSHYPRKGAVQRITPADAGKTLIISVIFDRRRDHPRGCGENASRRCKLFFYSGSPPRMRGKPERSEFQPLE